MTIQPDEEAELLDEDDSTTDDVVVSLNAPAAPAETLSPLDEKPQPEASIDTESKEKTPVSVKLDVSKLSYEEVCIYILLYFVLLV